MAYRIAAMDDVHVFLTLLHVYKWTEKKIKIGLTQEKSPFALFERAKQECLFAPNAFDCEKEIETAKQHKIEIIPCTSDKYPKQLHDLEDPPPLLYIRGDINLLHTAQVTIIGTRKASPLGLEQARYFASEIASQGIVVTSGLASGIDTAAHQGALSSGKTIAIIGSGLLRLYPAENEQLAKKIIENGALCSEFPLFMGPQKYTFPKRNRILAALCDAILLIEAPIKSGAMITMQQARKLQKKLFALPSRPASPAAQGNHLLLKEHSATLVDQPHEILLHIHTPKNRQHATAVEKTYVKNNYIATADEEKIIALLQNEEYSLDDISSILQLNAALLQSIMMKLVLKKIILELPGKHYTLSSFNH